MPLLPTPDNRAERKLFHNEWINVYPTTLPLEKIDFWKENNRTIFTFDQLCRLKGKKLEELSIDEITRFVAERDIHKLQTLADSIGRNGVQVPLIIRDDHKLLDGNRRFTDAWAQQIDFWFVRRTAPATNYQKIGSVTVAKTQCSAFLEAQNATLIECDLTTTAFQMYRDGAQWDGVLVAPGQGKDDPSYELVATATANPNNFTSFVRFAAARTVPANVIEAQSYLTGVTMPAFGASLGDAEQSFFEELTGMVTNLANIPRLIFVFRRTSKVGLLFEGERLHAADLVDAEQIESGNIAVYEEAGATARRYGDELHDLCARKFPGLVASDFVLHRGKSTCLFTCAPLGIFTHGYEVDTVEPVVRFYISKLFELWDDGVPCTAEQQAFFERHRAAWSEKQSEFIQFSTVTAT